MQDSTMRRQTFVHFLPETEEVKKFAVIRSLTDRTLPAKEETTLLIHVNRNDHMSSRQ
jgi:hypothetical protein